MRAEAQKIEARSTWTQTCSRHGEGANNILEGQADCGVTSDIEWFVCEGERGRFRELKLQRCGKAMIWNSMNPQPSYNKSKKDQGYDGASRLLNR